MIKWMSLFLGALLLFVQQGMAQTTPTPQKTQKTETIYIPTGNPPPATAEDFAQPFFAAPSTGFGVNEELEILKARVDKLEKIIESLQADKNVKTQPALTK